jgi:hypothetical protein
MGCSLGTEEMLKKTPAVFTLKMAGVSQIISRRERRARSAHWVHTQTFVWCPSKRVYHIVIRELIKLITGVQS